MNFQTTAAYRAPGHERRILCVFPRYGMSFGTFNYSFALAPPVKAFMPPQGLLLIAALMPKDWQVRFIDENNASATVEDFRWADAVFTSGMHIQREAIRDVIERGHRAGKSVILGGASASAAPEWYPEADIIHAGEAGDATLKIFEWVDRDPSRPPAQEIFFTSERLSMTEYPPPAYHLIDLCQYFLSSVQFSSGCPNGCEFCDVPVLYGRKPRRKTPAQIIAELDLLAAGGAPSVHFLDDNFFGDPEATRELLHELVAWQDKWDCLVRLSCEATLEISQHPDLCELLQKAYFTNIFCGVESPEPEALRAIKKSFNTKTPILEAIDTFNRYGMEVAVGLIMGFDTDTAETPRVLADFVRASQTPVTTLNILYALPKTPLYKRMETAGRIVSDTGRDSNIEFLRPYDELINDWLGLIAEVYEPQALYQRYETQAIKTYPNRRRPKFPLRQVTPRNLRRAFSIFIRLIWHVGIRSDYRRVFWRMFRTQLRRGLIENIFQIALVAHHLILYSRDTIAGRIHACHFAPRIRWQTSSAQLQETESNETASSSALVPK
ncbi:MAG: B12-binding domain-containing radical SAM protein [Syntrophobacteraceae bacterium]|nr:B12-binding domain-containing radical SAM protein [Syntrophobacteraceae bacterium]